MGEKSATASESSIFYYNPDHLGSTAVVTDVDGRITQNVVYIPFGEVFVEQRDGNWNTPYLFNAKELDEETGLYYYGARYLDPTAAQWLSVDPLFEKYAGMSPYNYCAGNPVVMVDPDGREGVKVECNPHERPYDKFPRAKPLPHHPCELIRASIKLQNESLSNRGTVVI